MPNLTQTEPQGQAKAKPQSLVVAFRCPPDLRRDIKIRVAQQDSSTEAVCIAALRLYLSQQREVA